jgi:hypothetical protein
MYQLRYWTPYQQQRWPTFQQTSVFFACNFFACFFFCLWCSLSIFPPLVYLTNICHLWMLPSLGEQRTCMNVDHLFIFYRLSVNVTQVRGIASVCLGLRVKSSLVAAFPQLICIWQKKKRVVCVCVCVCVWRVSFETSNGQVRESWEREQSNQADIWQMYPSTNVWQISHSHKQYCNLFAWLLVQWTVIRTLM